MMKRFFLMITIFLFLFSCSSTPEKYMSMSEYDLCVDYLSMGGNKHQSNRLEAIKRLGYNCKPYVEQAKAKKAADDAFYKSLEDLMDATIDCAVTECLD